MTKRMSQGRIWRILTQEIDGFAPYTDDEKGFALLSATIVLSLLMAFSVVVIDNSLNARRVGNSFVQSLSAEQIAEAGLHKAVFCLRATIGTYCAGTFGTNFAGETNVSFSGGRYTTTVSGTGTLKTVTSVGTSATGQTKTVKTDVSTLPASTSMPGFDNAILASDQGVNLSNNAAVNNGGVRSNSNVICGNNADINNDVTVSLAGGRIDNCDGVRDGRADQILSSEVTGNAYYRTDPTDIVGTTVAGTKYAGQATSAAQTFPAFDVATWRAAAEAGSTYSGNYSAGNNVTVSLGPIRINGNLTLGNNVTLNVTGPIWVNGNISVGNNVAIRVPASFGAASGLIMADSTTDQSTGGIIDISNNTTMSGSGTDGSYLFFVSTNTRITSANPAIRVSNNAGAAVFYATQGSVHINNNASAIAAVGRRVSLGNNATIAYDNLGTTPASLTVASTGSGTWRLKGGTWREFK